LTLLQVSNVLNQHKAELIEKRYRCNIGLFMCKFARVIYCLIKCNQGHCTFCLENMLPLFPESICLMSYVW